MAQFLDKIRDTYNLKIEEFGLGALFDKRYISFEFSIFSSVFTRVMNCDCQERR
jgi:hypothetical protein